MSGILFFIFASCHQLKARFGPISNDHLLLACGPYTLDQGFSIKWAKVPHCVKCAKISFYFLCFEYSCLSYYMYTLSQGFSIKWAKMSPYCAKCAKIFFFCFLFCFEHHILAYHTSEQGSTSTPPPPPPPWCQHNWVICGGCKTWFLRVQKFDNHPIAKLQMNQICNPCKLKPNFLFYPPINKLSNIFNCFFPCNP